MRILRSILIAVLILGLTAVTINTTVIAGDTTPPSSQPEPAAAPSDETNPSSSSPQGEETAAPAILAPSVTAPGTIYKMFTPSDFLARVSTFTFSWGVIYLYSTTVGSDFVARLDLPQGAAVTEVIFYLRDNSAASNVNMWLVRYTPSTGSYTDLITRSPVLNGTAIVADVVTPTTPIVIDNSQFSYQLQFRLNSGDDTHRIYGARVAYNLNSTFMPQIINP